LKVSSLLPPCKRDWLASFQPIFYLNLTVMRNVL
jgi:hypothetical protein